MTIITDRHIEIYQTTISDVRVSLGRWATIYLEPTLVECTWCVLDPSNDSSSGVNEPGIDWIDHPDYVDPYNIKICPECGGEGYVKTDNTKLVRGTKKDLSYNNREDSQVGFFRPGTIRFSCDLNDVLVDINDAKGDTWFHLGIKVDLDGETYNIINITKTGLRDLYTCRAILERTNI